MDEFARGFRLHTRDGHALDGARFPSGRCVVLDDPQYGLITASASLDVALAPYRGARVEWPDGQEPT